MAEAETKLAKKWQMFGNKYDDAVDLFKQAANLYKMGKAYQESGDAHKKQAECYVQLEQKHEAATAFSDSAKAYKQVNPVEAVNSLVSACEYYTEMGRFNIAAKVEQQIAEISEEMGELEIALEHYEIAAEYFEGEGQESQANKIKIKIADHMALGSKNYTKACMIYEKIGKEYLKKNLLKWSAKNLFIKAGICHICLDDTIGSQRAVENYCTWDVTFATQRECKFLIALNKSYKNNDSDSFAFAIQAYDEIKPLDKWMITLLSRAKEAISDENEDTFAWKAGCMNSISSSVWIVSPG